MKTVVLGGSSPSTPVLFKCLGVRSEIPPLEICLVGRSRQHLEGVLRAARILVAGKPILLQSASFAKLELATALRGADLVLVQVRFGDYAGRHFDETFPPRYGLCGDESLGPGGLSAAWRAWPAMHNLLAAVASACPDAIVLMLSSPVGIFVAAARQTFPALRTFGICELPWTTLRNLTTLLQADPVGTDFDYLGINHIGWFQRIDFKGRDLLQAYVSLNSGAEGWPSSQLVASCGGFPTKYLRLHYDRQQILKEQQQSSRSRADILKDIALKSYRAFESGGKQAILDALERRPAPWYEHAVVPFILSLAGVAVGIPCFLTCPTGQTHPRFLPDDILEVATLVSPGTFLHKACRDPQPSHILEIVEGFVIFERSATHAVVHRDRTDMQEALEKHPWVGSSSLAAALVQEITAQPQIETN